jgi:hypothetical protein
VCFVIFGRQDQSYQVLSRNSRHPLVIGLVESRWLLTVRCEQHATASETQDCIQLDQTGMKTVLVASLLASVLILCYQFFDSQSDDKAVVLRMLRRQVQTPVRSIQTTTVKCSIPKVSTMTIRSILAQKCFPWQLRYSYLGRTHV